MPYVNKQRGEHPRSNLMQCEKPPEIPSPVRKLDKAYTELAERLQQLEDALNEMQRQEARQ